MKLFAIHFISDETNYKSYLFNISLKIMNANKLSIYSGFVNRIIVSKIRIKANILFGNSTNHKN